jgi:signal transduction histidine kinase
VRIRSLLAIASRASLALTIVMAAALGISFFAVGITTSKLFLARAMRTTIQERIFLWNEFYVRREIRAADQFVPRSELLASQLKAAAASYADFGDRLIFTEMLKGVSDTVSIFQKLVSDNAINGQDSEYGKMLFDQFLSKSYILNDDAARLEFHDMTELASLNRSSVWLISACLLLVVALVLADGALIGRILGAGIRRLRDGAALVGGGDLQFRLAIRSDDEIDDVARSINKMAESLQVSFSAIEGLKSEAQQKAVALASSNSELEAFTYSVAHDLRAPLRSIEGFSRLLEEEFGPGMSGEGSRVLGIIREGVRKMDSLIANILEMSRVGKTGLKISSVDMKASARGEYSRIENPSVTESFDFSVGELPEAQADGPMIERVWANLLSNSIKYSIPAAVHRIEVGGRAEEGRNVYFVRDYGVGFDQKYADKLFVMFQRLHGEGEFEGNGIGLAIVQRIISRHGGDVWAEGSLGKGATFFFSLPTGRAS